LANTDAPWRPRRVKQQAAGPDIQIATVREAPMQGQIYEPLDNYEEAPEEAEVPHNTLFGQAEAEAIDTQYNTPEAYAERIKTYMELAPISVKDGMEKHKAELIEYLLRPDGDALHSHTHKNWHGLKITPVQIEFTDTLPTSVFQKARPVATHLVPKIKDLVAKLTNQGYLVYSMYGNYASPTLYVLKPDGSLSMCNDLRKINAYIKYSLVPQPHIHAGLSMLQDFKLFSELDWANHMRRMCEGWSSVKHQKMSVRSCQAKVLWICGRTWKVLYRQGTYRRHSKTSFPKD
jgi:hypothetical protein